MGEPGPYYQGRLSPDGTRAVVLMAEASDGPLERVRDLWTLDLEGGLRTRLTFLQNPGTSGGVWSPDGTRVAFTSGILQDTIYQISADGGGGVEEILSDGDRMAILDWSSDGRFMLFRQRDEAGLTADLWVWDWETRAPVELLATRFNEGGSGARFSRDMRWMAYASDDLGRPEVFVRRFLPDGPSGEPVLGEGRWQISDGGGQRPFWFDNGRAILYAGPEGAHLVEVSPEGDAFETGARTTLALEVPEGVELLPWGDVTADGQRGLLALAFELGNPESLNAPINVILNWRGLLDQ